MPLLIAAFAILLAVLLVPRFRPSLRLVIGVAALAALLLVTAWSYGLNHSLEPGQRYVPATQGP